jgi:hypothetical protein
MLAVFGSRSVEACSIIKFNAGKLAFCMQSLNFSLGNLLAVAEAREKTGRSAYQRERERRVVPSIWSSRWTHTRQSVRSMAEAYHLSPPACLRTD